MCIIYIAAHTVHHSIEKLRVNGVNVWWLCKLCDCVMDLIKNGMKVKFRKTIAVSEEKII